MTSASIIEQLNRRLANNHADPMTRLLRDLDELPDDIQRSPSARLEAMSRIATEERFNVRIDDAVLRINHAGEKLLAQIDESAVRWAENRHLAMLTSLIQKSWKSMPVNAEARRRAYYQVAGSAAAIFVVAWLSVIGAMKLGWLAHPALTEVENQQLQWAKHVQSSGMPAAIEWATEEINSEVKLQEARAIVQALDDDRNIRLELVEFRACRGAGMQLWKRPQGGTVCWFEYRVGP